MRAPVPAVLVAAVVAAAAAVVLGEYELVGGRAVASGLVFGVVVGEVLATIVRRADPYLLGAAALVAEAGLVWSVWISTGHDPGAAAPIAWVAVAVGTVAAPLWLRTAGRRGAHTPDGTAPAPGG